MSTKPRLRLAPEPFSLEVGPGGAIRQQIGTAGRLHMDRSLFFLLLHRTEDPDASVARQVAVHGSSYLIWQPEDDDTAMAALQAVVTAMRDRFGQILLISLYDQPPAKPSKEDDPHLPPFVARIGTGDDAHSERAAAMLADAMRDVEIDLRRCTVEHRSRPYFEPGVEALVDGDEGVSHLSLGLPRNYVAPTGQIYPQLFRDLSVETGDAVLRTACAFADGTKEGAPAHYRALGRSAFLAAALAADKKLDAIAGSFDFLLSVSPINSEEAMADFLAGGADKAPRFRYRPLEVDPDAAKRRLYAIDLNALEDPLLETLFAEKRREIEQQLTMLATRNTPEFRAASMLQYGAVEKPLLDEAEQILARDWPGTSRSRMIGASEVAKAAGKLFAHYRTDPSEDAFEARVELREDLAAGLMVSGDTLMISTHTRMAEHRLDALLAHEVSVHLLTYFNGAAQGLGIFRTGLAQYEGVQEGLGVFAEWAVGGLTPARLRLLAGRVVAVDAMLGGAGFVDVYRILIDRNFRERTAFSIAARVYRSGGFAKDAIYLRGFKAVCDLAAAGLPLDSFWLGKIAPNHIPAVEELLQRGLVRPALHSPEFLGRNDARRRLSRLAEGFSFAAILPTE